LLHGRLLHFNMKWAFGNLNYYLLFAYKKKI
jgi:hypothetical protein